MFEPRWKTDEQEGINEAALVESGPEAGVSGLVTAADCMFMYVVTFN